MNSHSRPRPQPSAAGIMPWMLDFVTRVLASSLNLPEPLVHNTGIFVFAHVQAVENSVGKTLCPVHLLRWLQNRRSTPVR